MLKVFVHYGVTGRTKYFVIANNKEEASAEIKKIFDEEITPYQWCEWPSTSSLTLVEEGYVDDDDNVEVPPTKVTKTVQQWIENNGPGLLTFTED